MSREIEELINEAIQKDRIDKIEQLYISGVDTWRIAEAFRISEEEVVDILDHSQVLAELLEKQRFDRIRSSCINDIRSYFESKIEIYNSLNLEYDYIDDLKVLLKYKLPLDKVKSILKDVGIQDIPEEKIEKIKMEIHKSEQA